MARKPNYGLSRSDVNRAKQARKTEKLRAREEEVARRRAVRDGTGPSGSGPDGTAAPETAQPAVPDETVPLPPTDEDTAQ